MKNFFKNLLKIPLYFMLFLISFVGLLLCLAGLFILTSPDVKQLKGCMTTNMFQVEVCPSKASYVTLNNISEDMIRALIVSEDAGFYQHKGFDWYELRESLEKNIQHRSIKRGGSTLTQQLAKNAFLNSDKSILRKLREAYLTYRIEQEFSKKEILEKYLNMVEFGKDLYGIKKAAQFYFKKSPRDLHVLEASFLVMLLPNPVKYSQSYRQRSLTKYADRIVKIILERLYKYQYLSPGAYQLARSQVVNFPWSHLSRSDFINAPSEGVIVDENDLNLENSSEGFIEQEGQATEDYLNDSSSSDPEATEPSNSEIQQDESYDKQPEGPDEGY